MLAISVTVPLRERSISPRHWKREVRGVSRQVTNGFVQEGVVPQPVFPNVDAMLLPETDNRQW
jgi:hypothetical protein